MLPSELLDKPEKWTKKVSVRDVYEKQLHSVFDDCATCWCILGALARCDRLNFSSQARMLEKHLQTDYIVTWNDAPERTFEEVRQVLLDCGL